ncbi:MAG: heme exporter protein CcmB [Spirochaetia bacterium]|jgi:heme exporter protein B|nr:heme exporter protein CcmB [Spirochaetia bacterium]
MRQNYAAGESNLAEILRNLKKDIRVEFRNPSALGTAISFACIITLAVSIVSAGIPFPPMIQAILLWIILFFSAMNALLHIFTREEEEHTALFLRLKISAESIYISKLIFNAAFFFFIEAVVCPVFIFFAGSSVKNPLLFVSTVIGGGLAIVSASTILSAMAAKAGGKGTLFTVISFPLLLPALLVSISTTAVSIESQDFIEYNNVFFLFAFSAAIIAISLLLFKYIWIEE